MTPAPETNKPGQKRLPERLFPHGTESIKPSDLSDHWTWGEVKPFLWIALALVVVGALIRWDNANPQEPVPSSSGVGR